MSEFRTNFRRNFIAGVATILPVWLTLLIVWFVFKWISGFAVPLLSPIFNFTIGREHLGKEQSIMVVRFVSFFLTIFVIWFTGLVATHIVGRRILLRMESLFIKLPVLKGIYLSVRKFVQFFYAQKQAFSKVVLIEFPRKGVYSMGFVTAQISDEIKSKIGDDFVNVFVPTVPNPTTGYLVMVPQKELIPLEMKVDEAFQLLVSGGILVPGEKSVKQPDSVSNAAI